MSEAIAEKKLSLIKRYPLETMVILLLFAISFVSFRQTATERKVDNLQEEIKGYFNGDRVKLQEQLFNTNETMKNTNGLLNEMRYYFSKQNKPL